MAAVCSVSKTGYLFSILLSNSFCHFTHVFHITDKDLLQLFGLDNSNAGQPRFQGVYDLVERAVHDGGIALPTRSSFRKR